MNAVLKIVILLSAIFVNGILPSIRLLIIIQLNGILLNAILFIVNTLNVVLLNAISDECQPAKCCGALDYTVKCISTIQIWESKLECLSLASIYRLVATLFS
jgi:hypothetical protein